MDTIKSFVHVAVHEFYPIPNLSGGIIKDVPEVTRVLVTLYFAAQRCPGTAAIVHQSPVKRESG